jgi:hypothetical protein
MPIYYSVVTDRFGAERWMADVIIQTEEPSDYADFPSALEALIQFLRERVEEEGGDPDEEERALDPKTPAEKLHQMLGDLEEEEVEDWESYVQSISQPEVQLGSPGESNCVNLAEVEGRKRAIQWLADNPLSISTAEGV